VVLIAVVVLSVFSPLKASRMDTDATTIIIAAELMQGKEGIARPQVSLQEPAAIG
jgi:hypothetical protein